MTQDPFLSFWVPVGSLIVAVLSVFVGPLVSSRIAGKQLETSQKIASEQADSSIRVATKQIVAPMRQEWIERLRDRVSEIQSTALWFYISGMDEVVDTSDEDEFDIEAQKIERKLLFLLNQVELMLNLSEPDHERLLDALKEVKGSIWPGSGKLVTFPDASEYANKVCADILKREWERVKNEI